MKHTLILLLFFVTSCLHADAGECLVFKAKYVLKNGQSFVGYLPITFYEVVPIMEGDKDKGFQQLMIQHFFREQRKIHVDIYKKIHVIKYKNDEKTKALMPIHFAFVDSNEVVRLHLDSIKYTIYLDVKSANFEWYGAGISVFDSTSVKTLRQTAHSFLDVNLLAVEPEMSGGKGAYIINYNPTISKKELILIDEQMKIMHGINPNGSTKGRTVLPKSENEQKDQLLEWRKKGVFIFYYEWWTC